MRLSRSKIELYIECPRCFYFDVVLKKSRPSNFPLNLNNAIDTLMKREFDIYRKEGRPHPIMLKAQLDFMPANHNSLSIWRNVQKGGLEFKNEDNGNTYFGVIDDIWVNSNGQYAIVDYKSTAKQKPVLNIPEWATAYSRQLSFYNYLLKKNGYESCNNGFLVYTTALTGEFRFDDQLKFSTNIISVEIDENWIEPTLHSIESLLNNNNIPEQSESCKFCLFAHERNV
jgi:RecB family exonuclease